MNTRAWRRYSAAALTLAAMGAQGAERVPLPPLEAPAEPATPESSVPDWLQRLGVESWWQVVRFAPWGASIGITFDDQQQRLRSGDGSTQRFSSMLWSEDFSIHNDAITVIDPRLFTSSLSLGLLLQQDRHEFDAKRSSQNGQLVNYAFEGIFLPESAYNANLSALRNESKYVLPSGSTTDTQVETRSLSFHMREDNILREREWLPYFTADLRLAQQQEKTVTRSADQVYRQDDSRDDVTLNLQNGGQTSDLSFQYQYSRLDNRAYEAGSYSSQSANFLYSLDFGATLNRRSDTRFNYYQRHGRSLESEIRTLDLGEFLTIDHNVNRSSYYNYQLTRQDTPFGLVTTQSASAQLYQQVYANLALTGNVTGVRTALPDGKISLAGVAGNANYSHALPWSGNLAMQLGGGYLVTESRVPGGVVNVTDAPYAVPPSVGAGTAILLKDRNIVSTSIVVIVLKGGARVPAVLDVDYTLLIDGDRTSIVPNPLSAVMLPGDTLNVTYNYQVTSDAKYATTSKSGSLSMDWSWVGGSFYHDESDQKPISGSDATLLVDQSRDNAMLWVRGEWRDVQARADAAMNRYDSTRLSYVERRLDQYLSWLPSPNVQVNLSATEYRTQYHLPEHETVGGSVRLDVQWTQGAWVSTAFASRRVYRDTLQPHETLDEAGLRLRRSWTKLELALVFGAQKRERGEASSVNGFFHFGAVRRF